MHSSLDEVEESIKMLIESFVTHASTASQSCVNLAVQVNYAQSTRRENIELGWINELFHKDCF